MVIALGAAALLSTLLGGLFALRFQDKLHLILGFSAGAVIGVAFFDLLPESIELSRGYSGSTIGSTVGLGFIIYLILDRLIFFHARADRHSKTTYAGQLGATTLSIHSCLDGIAIGLAFQVAPHVGLIVATAVVAHDFSDGINTVNVVMSHGGNQTIAFRWLLIDAIAPLIGAILTMFFSTPAGVFGRVLALFCGFFLYIGASDLLPESQHAHPTRFTTAATLLGAGTLFLLIQLVSL
jgi:zinc transporter ZupT